MPEKIDVAKETIPTLPNEVVLNILQFLPTKDILQHCRFVGKAWSDLSALACRKRIVILNDTKFYESPDGSLSSIFPPSEDRIIPWSVVRLTLTTAYRESSLNRQLGMAFGTKVHTLEVTVTEPNWDNLIHVLRFMPNLESLQIRPKYMSVVRQRIRAIPRDAVLTIALCKFPEKGVVVLSRLKSISFLQPELRPIDIEFTRFLVQRTGCHLNSFTWRCYSLKEEYTEDFLGILTTVPSLTLTLPLDHQFLDSWRMFADRDNSNIHNLGILLSGFQVTSTLKQITMDCLTSCQELTSLAIHYPHTFREGDNAEWLHIPPLPKLKTFTAILSPSSEQCPALAMPWYPINSRQFPMLETVRIKSSGGEAYVGDSRLPFPEIFDISSGSFEGVKTLMVGDSNYGEADKWARIFPNLTALTVTVVNNTDLEGIFKTMSKLEQLVLKFPKSMDINKILFTFFRGGLRHSCGLRRLTIEGVGVGVAHSEGTGARFLDSGAILLTLLPPLSLKVTGAKLSDNCISKLQCHHRSVEIN